MKLIYVGIGAFVLSAIVGIHSAYATEVNTIEFGQALPPGSKNEFLFFKSGPKGEPNPAYLEHLENVKSKEQLDSKLSILKDARISFLEVSPMLTLPGHSLWTFRLSGISCIAVGQTVRLSFEKTPVGLVLPKHIKGDSDQRISREATLPDALAVEGDRVFFEKRVTAANDFIDISVVAATKASDYLTEVKVEIPGYQPIKAMLPGPGIY
jgi:hypothetical protein